MRRLHVHPPSCCRSASIARRGAAIECSDSALNLADDQCTVTVI
jgi:hypothetical protein